MKPSATGLLPDNRSIEEKEFDGLTSEITSSPSPVPFSYLPSQEQASKYIDAFPWESQLGENSCVAHSSELAIAIYRTVTLGLPFVQLAPAFIYYYRINTPQPGMIAQDANNITESRGVPPFADYPSPQTDVEIDSNLPSIAVITEASKNIVGSWISAASVNNIDYIAGAANGLNVAVRICIFATIQEWSMQTPEILNPNITYEQAEVQHCITVLPNSAYLDNNGKRFVIIQDSYFFGSLVYRYVSEDFIASRCMSVNYIVNLQKTPQSRLSAYTFNHDLTIGSTGPDVLALQISLQQLGFFPSIINGKPFIPTGSYFGITKTAVLAFQTAYAEEILQPAGLTQGTGYFGISSRAQMNKLLNPTT